ncbi:COP23 domain-containing protein [Oscillatoria acuminata]|uniref:Lipoprotein n=1 Tax=Oscillatoria acuminata PCC 6304 TaxID=56110 RepID=K9TJE6_9CYAN|nr:COP23 domain-containing protein [Oscillatoria acuminata]AFY82523.1 hypothetical protein Oscil6304_2922 [Oscillatoria acuminata PCC 6304]
MSKQKNGVVFSILVILQGVLSACQPVESLPRGTDYSCDLTQNPPVTIARTSVKGDMPVIAWKSTFFEGSGYTPEKRCLEVSERLQTYYQMGLLHYLTTGVQDNQNIICVTRTHGGDCSGLLLTLEPGDNPEQVLKDLVNNQGRMIERSEGTGGKLYIELIPELQSP